MGAEESKCNGGSGCASFVALAADFPNSCRRGSLAVGWTLLHQTTVDKWREGHAEACNFNETVLTCSGGLHKDCSESFCISRQGFVNLSNSSTIFSFRKRSKFYKMAEHFEYNHIPAQMSSVNHFRVVSVICFRDKLVVLHLCRNGIHQLGLLDLGINKFMGVFAILKTYRSLRPDSLYGALSPDKSKCLVRMPSGVRRLLNDELHLYDLKTHTLQAQVLLTFTRTTHVVFDPRFCWTRAVVTNLQRTVSNNSISLVDLESMQPLHTNYHLSDIRDSGNSVALYPFMKDLQCTRDGSLIVATLVEYSCRCIHAKRTRPQFTHTVRLTIYILDSDTAQKLHCIQYSRFTCLIHLCPTNYIPVFSNCGSRMGVVMNVADHPMTHYVQIYKLPNVVNLQNMCRVVILQNVAMDSLTDLPLPVKVINYLHFKPEY